MRRLTTGFVFTDSRRGILCKLKAQSFIMQNNTLITGNHMQVRVEYNPNLQLIYYRTNVNVQKMLMFLLLSSMELIFVHIKHLLNMLAGLIKVSIDFTLQFLALDCYLGIFSFGIASSIFGISNLLDFVLCRIIVSILVKFCPQPRRELARILNFLSDIY